MPAFPKPNFDYSFDLFENKSAIRLHKEFREIPEPQDNELLIASWNIANLGLHKRELEHYRLITLIISYFDVIAIQEVNRNIEGLMAIFRLLPFKFNYVFSDVGGNNERSLIIYNELKVSMLNQVGEIAISPKDYRFIKLDGVMSRFNGFDRNPYLCTFASKDFVFTIITCHSYFGSKKNKDVERRSLEAYAVGRYAHLASKNKNSCLENIICLGDFNIPKIDNKDMVYKALIKRGLTLPDHSTKVYSNITNDKQYDQIAFLPQLKKHVKASGVFDFDSVLFADLYKKDKNQFLAYMRYFISDHRLLWFQLTF